MYRAVATVVRQSRTRVLPRAPSTASSVAPRLIPCLAILPSTFVASNGMATASTSPSVKVLEEGTETLNAVTTANKKVLAYFTATIAPHFASLAAAEPGIVFVKVDVDANSDTAEAASIRAVPTFIAYADGKKVKEFSGASIDMLKGLVDTLKAKA